jgi:NAD-dependent SIR2 family protein deacetylase
VPYCNETVSSDRVVYSHGSLRWAQCMRCQSKVDSEFILQQIIQTGAAIPKCSSRKQLSQKRTSTTAIRHSAKRACSVSTRSTQPNITNGTDFCDGIMRPCITFFGEKIHSNVNRLLQADRKMADALIVIGTSLSV